MSFSSRCVILRRWGRCLMASNLLRSPYSATAVSPIRGGTPETSFPHQAATPVDGRAFEGHWGPLAPPPPLAQPERVWRAFAPLELPLPGSEERRFPGKKGVEPTPGAKQGGRLGGHGRPRTKPRSFLRARRGRRNPRSRRLAGTRRACVSYFRLRSPRASLRCGALTKGGAPTPCRSQSHSRHLGKR